MSAMANDRMEFLQGTLDMIVLRTLMLGRAHGHEIARHIQRVYHASRLEMVTRKKGFSFSAGSILNS